MTITIVAFLCTVLIERDVSHHRRTLAGLPWGGKALGPLTRHAPGGEPHSNDVSMIYEVVNDKDGLVGTFADGRSSAFGRRVRTRSLPVANGAL